MPIDVWSAMKLDDPTAGNVAVPTMSRGVGGTLIGASLGEPYETATVSPTFLCSSASVADPSTI